MTRHLHRSLVRWLEAERRDDAAAAERALAALWHQLPRPAPSRAFTRRTLSRVRRAGAGVGAWTLPLPQWLRRSALAASLALTAMSLAYLPASLITVAQSGDRLFDGAVGWVGAASERLAHGLTAWSVATRVSRSLVEGLAEPGYLAGLSLALLMSFFAFGWLHQLLGVERSSGHV